MFSLLLTMALNMPILSPKQPSTPTVPAATTAQRSTSSSLLGTWGGEIKQPDGSSQTQFLTFGKTTFRITARLNQSVLTIIGTYTQKGNTVTFTPLTTLPNKRCTSGKCGKIAVPTPFTETLTVHGTSLTRHFPSCTGSAAQCEVIMEKVPDSP